MPTPPPLQPNFDRIARPYHLLEHLTFGSALDRARNHFVPGLADRTQALILGDGDGRFSARLLARYTHLRADAVDLSPAMLTLLTRHASAAHPTSAARLQTHNTNALAFAPAPGRRYDLVVTHYFLDCLTQPDLDQLCDRLRPHLAPNAAWLLSDFRVPESPLRLPAAALIRSLYLSFRILTGLRTNQLPDHASALTRIGFTRTAHHVSLAGILTSELWRLPGSAQE